MVSSVLPLGYTGLLLHRHEPTSSDVGLPPREGGVQRSFQPPRPPSRMPTTKHDPDWAIGLGNAIGQSLWDMLLASQCGTRFSGKSTWGFLISWLHGQGLGCWACGEAAGWRTTHPFTSSKCTVAFVQRYKEARGGGGTPLLRPIRIGIIVRN